MENLAEEKAHRDIEGEATAPGREESKQRGKEGEEGGRWEDIKEKGKMWRQGLVMTAHYL